MLVSNTTSILNPSVPSTHGSSRYVKTYQNFWIIHKKAPCCGIELKTSSLHAYHISHCFPSPSLITQDIEGPYQLYLMYQARV